MHKFIDLILLLSLLFTIVYQYSSTRVVIQNEVNNHYFKFYVAIISIVTIYSLRDLGLDLEVYRRLYDNYNTEGEELYKVELGWSFIIPILKSFDMPFSVFLFFSSVIPFSIIWFVALRVNMGNLFWGVLIGFYLLFLFHSLNGLRAFFSSSFVLLAIYSYMRKSKWKYLFYVGIALLFHLSAVVAFLIPLFSFFRWRVLSWLLVLLIGCIISFFLKFALSDFYNYKDTLVDNSFLSLLEWKLLYYLVYIDQVGYSYLNLTHEILSESIAFTSFLTYFIIALLLFSIKFNSDFENICKNIYLNSLLMCIFLYMFGGPTIAIRLFLMINLCAVYLFPTLLHSGGALNKKLKLLLVLITILNFILVILYNAGLHQSTSILYLGI